MTPFQKWYRHMRRECGMSPRGARQWIREVLRVAPEVVEDF